MITWLVNQNKGEQGVEVRGKNIHLFIRKYRLFFKFSVSFASRKATQKMGRIFLDHPGGTRLYSCANCDTALTNRAQLTSMVSLTAGSYRMNNKYWIGLFRSSWVDFYSYKVHFSDKNMQTYKLNRRRDRESGENNKYRVFASVSEAQTLYFQSKLIKIPCIHNNN